MLQRARRGLSALEGAMSTRGVAVTAVAAWAAGAGLLAAHAARTEAARRAAGPLAAAAAAARACGALVNLHAAALLLCATRPFVGFLRETPAALVLPLDALMPGVHAALGIVLIVVSAVHVAAQCVMYTVDPPWAPGVFGGTSLFATGLLLTIALIGVRMSAWMGMQRHHYELFLRGHMGGSTVFYGLLCMHGVRKGSPTSWMWLVGPLVLYVLGRIVRIMRERRSYLFISKHSAAFHGPAVLRLRLPRVFHFRPGQYAELKVPEISSFQWHAFTIASAPHEPEMVFYVKVAGDWTTNLFQLFAARLSEDGADDIEIHISGPFGAPAQHVEQYDHLVLIGGGVGATPFCSVVKSLDHWMMQWARATPATRKRRRRKEVRPPFREPTISFGLPPRDERRADDSDTPTSDSSSTCAADEPSQARAISGPTGPYRSADLSVDTYYTANSHMTGFRTRQIPLPTAEDDIERTESARWAASIHTDPSVLTTCAPGRQRRPLRSDESPTSWDVMSKYTSLSSMSYWQALHSFSDALQASRTFNEGLDILISMSYGVPDLMQALQARTRDRDSLTKPLDQVRSADPAAVDLTILHDRRFQLLMYSKSATVSVILLWAVGLRILLAAIAAEAGTASLSGERLSVHTSVTLLWMDTAVCAILAAGTALPVFLELQTLGSSSAAKSWLDSLVVAPMAAAALVLNGLALGGVGEAPGGTSARSGMALLAPCGVLIFGLVGRLTRVAATRAGAGFAAKGHWSPGWRDPAATRSVDFIWTTPTRAHDAWLVSELRTVQSPRTRLHRYVTREDAPDVVTTEDAADGKVVTAYGRPDWDEVLNRVAERARNGATVGVFVCGPAGMARSVAGAAGAATRNSIVRGLQGGHAMRALEQAFGAAVSANEYTGDSGVRSASGTRGCNVRLAFHRERFS